MRVSLRSRIALVHDDLIQWGGAERVLLTLSEVFPEAPIYTSIYNQDNPLLNVFKNKRIVTSFIQKIPLGNELYKLFLPLYPLAFEQFDFSEYDLVISQSTRFAKLVITKPKTVHISYCHTPPRFLWSFSGQKVRSLFELYFKYLRRFDFIWARRVDKFLAGSKNAQRRINDVYHQDSVVLYPPLDLNRFKKVKSFAGGYLLIVARLNSYKRVDLAIRLANQHKLPLKVVGGGPQRAELEKLAGETVEFLGQVSEEQLVLLIAGCQALIVAAEEDFGLTPLEAQALGKPVVAYGKGGASETVIDGVTGYLYQEQTVEAITAALVKLEKRGYNEDRCVANAARFSKERFKKKLLDIIKAL